MKGKPEVMKVLQEALKSELTAINQYFIHAEMCENWGYHKLAEVTKKEAIDEMKHAEKLIERILFLDGTPNMSDYYKINVGENVKKQLQNDLDLELVAVQRYNDAIEVCVKNGDNGSRDLLLEFLKDEEKHVDFLEAQLHAIGEVGLENYLAQWISQGE